MKKVGENIYEIELNDIKGLFHERDHESHKGMFGTVGIIGGSLEYSGAIKLASMSAAVMRGGCGVVRVIVPESLASAVLPYLVEQTLYPLKSDKDHHMKFDEEDFEKAIKDLKAIGIGMGWGSGKDNELFLKKLLLDYSGTLVIDADGLNTLSKMDKDLLKNAKPKVVLTPHLKEFERLTNIPIEEIKKNSVSMAKDFALKYHIILLLKGATTIVTDGKVVYLSKSGSPGMATAGSGDVLSGVLVGMLGYLEADLLNVAAATYLTGKAGELAAQKYTDISMVATDTIEFIPQVIKNIRNDIE